MSTYQPIFSYAGLVRLTKANHVTMKLEEVALELEGRHLEAFRDLASKMLP